MVINVLKLGGFILDLLGQPAMAYLDMPMSILDHLQNLSSLSSWIWIHEWESMC